MTYQNTFETFNPNGRRVSRERKKSAALRLECWRAVDLFSLTLQKPSWAGILHCCSLTRGPPHSTTFLTLTDVRKVDQNLGGFCQNPAKTLATSTRILPTKYNRVGQTLCQEIVKKTYKNGSQNTKIHQNCKKCSPIKKISPHEPKSSQNGAK